MIRTQASTVSITYRQSTFSHSTTHVEHYRQLAILIIYWAIHQRELPDYWVAKIITQYSWQSYPHELVFDARLAWKKSHAAPLVEVVLKTSEKAVATQAELTSQSVNQESVYVRVSHEFLDAQPSESF